MRGFSDRCVPARSFAAPPAALLALALALALGLALLSEVAYADSASSSSASSAASSKGKSEPAVATDPFADAAEVNADDGLYLVDVELEAEGGGVKVASPAELEVFDGHSVVKLACSGSNCDYLVVKKKKYVPANGTANPTFVVPVVKYDKPFSVVAGVSVGGKVREVDCKLTVPVKSVQAYDATKLLGSGAEDNGMSAAEGVEAIRWALYWPWIVFSVCVVLSAVVIGVAIGILRGYRNR